MNPLQPKSGTVKPNIDLSQTTAEKCENCTGEAFRDALLLRKVSALLTETGKEGYLPIQVFACVKCGHVNSHFIPSELKVAKSSIVQA
jgi:hypothetical protein